MSNRRRVLVAIGPAALVRVDASSRRAAELINRLVPTGVELVTALVGLSKLETHALEHELQLSTSSMTEPVVVVAGTYVQVALIAEHRQVDDLLILGAERSVQEDGAPDAKFGLATLRVDDARNRALTASVIGPEVEACCRFVERTGKRAVVGALDEIMAVYLGGAGTTIVASGETTTRVVAPAVDANPVNEMAVRVLSLIDLTNLTDDCDDDAIVALCTAALDERGHVPAVCIWPRFITVARTQLAGTDVRIATVVNFPDGTDPLNEVLRQTGTALADGADEIDLVLPWQAFLAGDTGGPAATVAAVRNLIGPTVVLKVILESGLYPDQASVAQAAQLAIDAGADFLKTSTGKKAVSATPEAVTTLLRIISTAGRTVGIKPSGGIRTLDEAARYLLLADDAMGSAWATPATFRFGASGLHTEVLAVLVAS